MVVPAQPKHHVEFLAVVKAGLYIAARADDFIFTHHGPGDLNLSLFSILYMYNESLFALLKTGIKGVRLSSSLLIKSLV